MRTTETRKNRKLIIVGFRLIAFVRYVKNRLDVGQIPPSYATYFFKKLPMTRFIRQMIFYSKDILPCVIILIWTPQLSKLMEWYKTCKTEYFINATGLFYAMKTFLTL